MTGRAGPLGSVSCRSVRSSGFLGTAYLTPRIASVAVLSLPRRAWFRTRFLTWSGASLIRETMWNESGTRPAFDGRSFTLASIHLAPSPVTALMEARCSSVSRRRNRPGTSLPYPSCAQATRLRLWSTATVMYVCPFLWLVSSTPIAVGPSNMHGIEDSKRAATLRAIWPAVLHAMRGNPPMVFWLATAAGHAHSISKPLVSRLSGSAHGTWAAAAPCSAHATRGARPMSSTP